MEDDDPIMVDENNKPLTPIGKILGPKGEKIKVVHKPKAQPQRKIGFV